MTAPLRHGPWRLSDLQHVPKNGLKVFSCFHCAGGSTMGYKLAGYDVLGGVEIDKAMMHLYRLNHRPRHSYLESIVDFNKRSHDSLPDELLDLDILDGSPPCSSFSTVGSREKGWGVLKLFREGQSKQILDDLFGHFLMTIELLRPRVVIAENVKGMLLGNARGYIKEIFEGFKLLGYSVQLFLLNAATMGVPQRRERVFFIANRLNKRINLQFTEPPISLHEAIKDVAPRDPKMKSALYQRNWSKAKIGGWFAASRNGGVNSANRLDPRQPAATLIASDNSGHWSEPRNLQELEINRIQTFPEDFDFADINRTYVCGMSVPPYMMQRVALEVYKQIFMTQTGNGTEAEDA